MSIIIRKANMNDIQSLISLHISLLKEVGKIE
ncbi:hypothetical protein DJ93_2715 [Bacillus clarus]|uniref:Uncharacterized protein n=1 Tax=Bacillus clarus TaxID=2338372 RepID=A0A090YTQ7_9BACI|nr:hypothetical protein DJ93_2715 [Bacillus clarus]